MNAPYIIMLTRKPVPCSVTAPKAMVRPLIRDAAASDGSASIRFEAKGAVRRRGYAGNIQMGVMVWMGKDLVELEASRLKMTSLDALLGRPEHEVYSATSEHTHHCVKPETYLHGRLKPCSLRFNSILADIC